MLTYVAKIIWNVLLMLLMSLHIQVCLSNHPSYFCIFIKFFNPYFYMWKTFNGRSNFNEFTIMWNNRISKCFWQICFAKIQCIHFLASIEVRIKINTMTSHRHNGMFSLRQFWKLPSSDSNDVQFGYTRPDVGSGQGCYT